MSRQDRPVTPLTYITEILSSSWKHGAELAVAAGSVVVIGLTALLMRSMLHLQAFSGRDVVFVLLPLVGAAMMFVAVTASWRLYRRQWVALATTRSLLDLNARDRADLERDFRARSNTLSGHGDGSRSSR